MDDDNSKSLDIHEFKKACKDFRFDLSEKEIIAAFNAFDRSGDGLIDYEEFLAQLRVFIFLTFTETHE